MILLLIGRIGLLGLIIGRIYYQTNYPDKYHTDPLFAKLLQEQEQEHAHELFRMTVNDKENYIFLTQENMDQMDKNKNISVAYPDRQYS